MLCPLAARTARRRTLRLLALAILCLARCQYGSAHGVA